MNDSSVQKEKDSAVDWWAIIWSLIYGFAFFPLLFVFVIWAFVLLEEGFSWISTLSVLVGFSIPLSLPISIYLMWQYHNRGKYGAIYLVGCIPWMIVGSFFFIGSLFSYLQNLWKDIVVFPWHASGTPTSCIPHLFSALGN